MKTVILAGGLGTRLGEETALRPKPMVEIGGKPIIWHIMKSYSAFGLNEFIVCLGYKGYMIKEYFANYLLHTADVTIDLQRNELQVEQNSSEPWRITLVETGADTMTGGRLKAVAAHLPPGEPFCFTYGDGVSDVDIGKLIAFHRSHGKRATVTAVTPPARFGALEFSGDLVTHFQEKRAGDGGQINAGFFVLDPSVTDLIKGPDTAWEAEPLQRLAKNEDLVAYRHDGFWHPMDTPRDKQHLEDLWSRGEAPWRRW